MSKIDVVMPKMGESVMEGTVLTWHKKPGDPVDQDETLLEIGTDKVDSEIPSPSSGKLAEILVDEGATVEVGTILARIETDVAASGGDGSAAPEAAPASVPAEPEPQAAPVAVASGAQATRPAPAKSPAAAVDVVMPKMGESVMEGTVIAWHKKPGDPVDLDETLLEIGTDKVDSEIPSPASGTLQEILVPEGATVEVGTVLGRLAVEGSVQPVLAGEAAPQVVEPVAPAAPAEKPEGAPEGPAKRRGSDGRFYSPLVRSIAQEEHIEQWELERIEGSGKDGRVTKKDVLSYLDRRRAAGPPVAAPAMPAGQGAPTPGAPAVSVVSAPPAVMSGERVEIVEMDRMRQIIAEHMVRSKATSAHVTSFGEADVTGLVRLRESRKEAFQKREGVKLTYTPFFVRAAADALREHPLLNSSIDGKNIIIKKDLHIGIAVAVGARGLVVPVIRDAGGKNLAGLARAAAELAERARSKQLQPDDLQGGTFTVTNVGSLGSIIGTPIINQPQVAILAVGTIKKRPVVLEDPDLGDVIAIRHMMYLSLTYDHRLIDGAMGASFMHAVIRDLESIGPDDEI